MSRELIKDSFLYLPARVIPVVVAVVAIPVVTRLIPPEQYGQYTLVLNSFQLLAVIFKGVIGIRSTKDRAGGVSGASTGAIIGAVLIFAAVAWVAMHAFISAVKSAAGN